MDPRLAEARLGYAVTLADAGRYATARAWLNEGRRSHPDRLEFVELLVRLLAAAPDPNVRDGRTAVDLGTRLVRQGRSWRTLEALAMALAETGQWAEAAARQRDAIEASNSANRDVRSALDRQLAPLRTARAMPSALAHRPYLTPVASYYPRRLRPAFHDRGDIDAWQRWLSSDSA